MTPISFLSGKTIEDMNGQMCYVLNKTELMQLLKLPFLL